jgi:DNA-binding transcriptional regulator YdaS (Cro superfamily)
MIGNQNPIEQIVARFGGQSALARLLNTSQGTVWGWIEKGRVPSARIPAIIEAAKALNPPVHLQANDFFGLQHSEEAA